MKRYAIISAILLVALVGCEKEEPEPETPPPPPPPTAQQLSGGVIRVTQLAADLPEAGSEIDVTEAQAWLASVQQEKNKIAGELNAPEAIGQVSRAISKRARALAELELWSHVMAMCDAHKVFDPGSDTLTRLREKAFRELSKPVVTLKILGERDGVHTLIVNMRIPLTGEVFENVKMAVGDIEHGVKFLSVIGRNQGVRIEYQDGGDQLDIMNPPML